MLPAATETGTAVRLELIAYFACWRRAEIHVYCGNIILVVTRDVLSFASVHPDSFQLSPHV